MDDMVPENPISSLSHNPMSHLQFRQGCALFSSSEPLPLSDLGRSGVKSGDTLGGSAERKNRNRASLIFLSLSGGGGRGCWPRTRRLAAPPASSHLDFPWGQGEGWFEARLLDRENEEDRNLCWLPLGPLR